MNETPFKEKLAQSNTDDDCSFYKEHYHCETYSRDMLELWLDHLIQEETHLQSKRITGNVSPFLAIPTTVIEIIFYVCEEFQQSSEVRYLTVELFDRFINNQFLLLKTKIWQDDSNNFTIFESHNWKQISPRIQNQSLLRIMSCLAIASKFVLYNKVIPMKKIQDFLQKCGKPFSMKTIFASEMRVFKILDYKLHFPTVLTHTDLLIEMIRFPKKINRNLMHKLSLKVIDVTYLHHQEIYHKLFYYSTGRWEKTNEERKDFRVTEINNLLLAAAVIVSTSTIIEPQNVTALSNEIATKLDKLTRIPAGDIIALASIVTMIILA